MMFTIKENVINTYEVKKSKFITLLYKVDSLKEIKDIIKEANSNYKDATHVCFAYILDNNIKFSDDGEPNGTAGMPILNVLTKKDLNHILCIVVRYFGGIKLGASGLVRTYSKCVSESIKDIVPLKKHIFITIEFKYENEKEIENLLSEYEIINKLYSEFITYHLSIEVETYNLIKEKLNKIAKIKEV